MQERWGWLSYIAAIVMWVSLAAVAIVGCRNYLAWDTRTQCISQRWEWINNNCVEPPL